MKTIILINNIANEILLIRMNRIFYPEMISIDFSSVTQSLSS
jgi:hypothetical protein